MGGSLEAAPDGRCDNAPDGSCGEAVPLAYATTPGDDESHHDGRAHVQDRVQGDVQDRRDAYLRLQYDNRGGCRCRDVQLPRFRLGGC